MHGRPPAEDALPRRVPLLVFLSGASGLLYESLWMRAFGVVFGNTTDAVATVLATFMGGLALGGVLVARRPAARPLRAYARVELGVGAAALLALPLLKALPRLAGLLGGHPGFGWVAGPLGRGLAAVVIVLPATVLLGATVPLVVEFLTRSGRTLPVSFGRLYLLNTLGGALGVALGAFLLLPSFGVTATYLAAVLVNLVIGGLARRWSLETPTTAPAAPETAGTLSPLVPALAVMSGAFAFGMEVVWTRSLVLVIGSSVYAFNLILLAVLLGIAGGTAFYDRRPPRSDPVRALGLLFLLAGLLAAASAWVVGRLPGAYLAAMERLPVRFTAVEVAGFGLCLLALLPVTLVLGLTFPLLTHLVERVSAQRVSGLLYAWNTAGAIAGALGGDLVLIRDLGLQQSYVALAALPLVAGAATLTWRRSRPARVLAPLGAAAAAALAIAFWRPWDPIQMTSGVYLYGTAWRERPDFSLGDLARERRLLFYREGREAVVAVAERVDSGRRFLSVNGKTDAGNGDEDVLTQKFLAHVPLLAHPDPRRVLVIGWGSGATAASAALYPVRSLTCVEIEPATFAAAPFFDDLNGRLLRDPRFRIVFADGRNRLLRPGPLDDVIISEPSNPWISGVSNLFTLEFYEAVLGRLAPGGVFGQWFHYYNLEPADVKVELATFARVFPEVSVWLVPPAGAMGGELTADLLLVGSRRPVSLDWTRLRHAFADPALGADLRKTGALRDAASLVAAWAMDRPGLETFTHDPARFPRGTPLNTDDYPWIEFRAPRSNVLAPRVVALRARALYRSLALAGGDAAPPVTGLGEEAAAFDRKLAERYLEFAQPERARQALARSLSLDPGSAPAQARLGELLLGAGRAGEAEPHLALALRLDPSLDHARELLGHLYIDRKDYARAEEVHREIVRRHPKDVDAWLRLGGIRARQRQWKGAQAALEMALSLDHDAPVDPQLLAYIRERADRP